MDDIDWSQYCVVRINEYKDMRAEIERLREAVDEYKHRLHWANEELLKRGRP